MRTYVIVFITALALVLAVAFAVVHQSVRPKADRLLEMACIAGVNAIMADDKKITAVKDRSYSEPDDGYRSVALRAETPDGERKYECLFAEHFTLAGYEAGFHNLSIDGQTYLAKAGTEGTGSSEEWDKFYQASYAVIYPSKK